jgi:hypothetical protein
MIKVGGIRQRSRLLPKYEAQGLGVYCTSHVPELAIVNHPTGKVTLAEGSEAIAYTTRRVAERYKTNFVRHDKTAYRYLGNASDADIVRVWTNGTHAGHGCRLGLYHFVNSYSLHSLAVAEAYSPSKLGTPSGGYYGNQQTDMDDNFTRVLPNLRGISLPNFLLELDDIPKLWRSWKEKVLAARKAGRKIPKASHMTLGNMKTAAERLTPAPGDVSRGAANQWLELNFGILPLIGDLIKIHEILTGLYARIKDFETAANEVFTHKRTLTNERLVFNGTVASGAHSAAYNALRHVHKGIGLKYRLNPLAVTGDYKRMLKAYMTAFGFNLNPRIVWDAIPFTFVLDWFLGVGSWLERHSHDTLNIPVAMIDGYAFSRATWTVTTQYTHGVEPPWPPYTSAGWATVTTGYTRTPVLPSWEAMQGIEPVDFGEWKNPTLRQWSLAVSLGTVLRKRTKESSLGAF